MREKSLKLLVTFHTTAGAMSMEKLCKRQEIPGRLIPVPRSITADCGMAWCTVPEQRPIMEALIAREGLDAENLHELMI